jgi:hypothetical protein
MSMSCSDSTWSSSVVDGVRAKAADGVWQADVTEHDGTGALTLLSATELLVKAGRAILKWLGVRL